MIQFTDLQNFNDEDLLEILKLVPAEVLLSALHSPDAKPVLQRVCETISVTAGQYLTDDLAEFMKTSGPNPEREKCQAIIAEIASQLIMRGEITGAPNVPRLVS